MFSSDRDLLSLEPNLFRDISFLAQTLALTSGSLSAGTLTLTDPIPASTVGPGNVALIGRTPMEILAAPSPDTLVLSLTRPDPTGPQIIPADRATDSVAIVSFRPQLSIIHRQLLAMLAIAPDAQPAIGVVTEQSITNPRDLTLVESLGALHLIYAAASSTLPESAPASQRARSYLDRFNRERWRARAHIDLNNDGLPDAQRTLSILHITRQ